MPNGARARPNLRPDHNGPQQAQFESNKKKTYMTQKVCGICGKPVAAPKSAAKPTGLQMHCCIFRSVPAYISTNESQR